ncbi:MAG: ribosome biogenesis GTPase Der [Candidatus Izemoplasmatales bacterium]|nr:ribosome biogenesis GTPase Der [Candidatus Izemoplasmatales bacterium]MDD3864756.1 ribosome biogenesis GTPase Der [Candidatus Izemoplasmatales bacterium]
MMLPIVAIVGRPNVGKSTIFNRIIGDRISITDDTPGITRDRIYAKSEWYGRKFNVIDTGGIEISDAPFLAEIKAQVEIAIEESNVIIFVVDVHIGLINDDFEIMKLLFQSKKPVLIAVNKVDDLSLKDHIYDFYSLGADDVIAVSGIHGIGMGDLMEKIIQYLPNETFDEYTDDYLKLCVVGRPNVGKSSLTNAILGQDRVIVSDIGGTTTDSIDTEFVKDEQKYVVIDTAGLRKRGKIFESVEKYSYLRAMEAIERSDVCLLLLDAIAGIQEQDKHIAGYILENGKAMIIIVNKWDAIVKNDQTMTEFTKVIREEFQFLPYVPVVFLSAKTKARVATLFPVITRVFANYQKRISTSTINEVVSDAMSYFPPKEHNQTVIKVYYVTQVAIKCPTFVLFVNDIDALHFSYYRYLENRIRERFDFEGTPIKLILRKRE